MLQAAALAKDAILVKTRLLSFLKFPSPKERDEQGKQ
jgi:hypothetical protein